MSVEIELNEDEPQELEEVILGAFTYQFAFPKAAPLLTALSKASRIKDQTEQGVVALDAQEKWMANGFGPDQWAHIQGRLVDESDKLDSKHLILLFQKLMEKGSGDRPPIWRGDSSAVSPQAFQRRDVPKPQGSTTDVSPLIVSATS